MRVTDLQSVARTFHRTTMMMMITVMVRVWKNIRSESVHSPDTYISRTVCYTSSSFFSSGFIRSWLFLIPSFVLLFNSCNKKPQRWKHAFPHTSVSDRSSSFTYCIDEINGNRSITGQSIKHKIGQSEKKNCASNKKSFFSNFQLWELWSRSDIYIWWEKCYPLSELLVFVGERGKNHTINCLHNISQCVHVDTWLGGHYPPTHDVHSLLSSSVWHHRKCYHQKK